MPLDDEEDGERTWTHKPITRSNGSIYEGQIDSNGKRDGHGILIDEAKNKVFEGTWRKGQLSGHGRIIIIGDEVQEGEFEDGLLHGLATIFLTAGEKYRGEWKANKRDGE